MIVNNKKKQLSLMLGLNLLTIATLNEVDAAENKFDVTNLNDQLSEFSKLQQITSNATNKRASLSKQNEQYLSDLKPQFAEVGYARLQNDCNVNGKPIQLTIDGKSTEFAKGVAAHAPAKIVYQIPKGVNIFETYLGVDNHQNGDVAFSIYLDDVLVYDSGKVTKNNTQHIMVEIKGQKELKVIIDDLGFKGQDHSILADAQFYQADLTGFDTTKFNVVKPTFEFGKATDADYQLQEAQYEFIQNIGKTNLFTFLVADASNEAFLNWLLNNPTMLTYYNTTTAPRANNKIGFLKQLKRIVTQDASAKTNPMNQKIAMATALEFANDDVFLWVNRDSKSDAVRRYEIFRDLNNTPGALRPIFKTLDVQLMRSVVCAQMNDSDFIWIREKVKREHPELLDSNSQLSNVTFKYIAYNPFNKYGDNVQRPGYYGENPNLATVIELGGVCGTVSKFDVNVLRAFGVPANVIGQPGHAAITYMTDEGNWAKNNNISSWGRTQGGTSTALAQGSSGFNNTYNLLDFEARQDIEKYDLANEYYQILQETTNRYERAALQEKILALVPLYVPVYHEKIDELESQPVKNAQEFHDLALRIIKTFRNYPKPMSDLLARVTPILNEPENRVLLVDVAVAYNDMVANMSNPYAIDVFQEEEFQNQYHAYQTILGSFSFDGVHANQLMGSKTDTEYSLDGGVTYLPITEENQALLNDDVDKITVASGVLLRLRGTDNVIKINFTSKEIPKNVISDDNENRIIGLTSEMEYSLDGGQNWLASELPADLSGNKTVLVRYKKTGTNIGGLAKKLTFTENKQVFNRIKCENISLTNWTSEQNDTSLKALNVIDGDLTTMWHTIYNRGDHKPHLVFKFNHAYTVNQVLYTPRQDGGTNGNVEEYTIYTSTNGKDFTPIKTGKITYTRQDRKETRMIPLPAGQNHTQYIKFEINKGVNDFGAAVEIGFEIPKVEAEQADAAVAEDKAAKTAEIISKQLKEITVEANSLLKTTNNSTIQAEIKAIIKQANDLANQADTPYRYVLTLHQQLANYRDQIILGKSEAVINSDSKGVKEYLATYTGLLMKPTNQLSVADYPQVLEAIKAFEQLSTSDQQAIEYVKNNLVNKQNIILSSTGAQIIQTKYRKVLALTDKTVKKSDYHLLNEAYYNTFALNNAAQSQVLAERQHLKQLIDLLDANQAIAKDKANVFKQAHHEILSLALPAMTVDNFLKYQALVTQAEDNYRLLPTNVQTKLTAEVAKLTVVKERIAELEVTKAKQELASVIEQTADFFKDTIKYQLIWRDEITAAKEVLASKVPSKSVYAKAITDLVIKKAELQRMIDVDQDNHFRANQFKERFDSLLMRANEHITEADRELLDKAKDQFRRLNDETQALLVEERVALNVIDAKLNPTQGAEKLAQVIEKIKAAQASVYEPYQSQVADLLADGMDVSEEDKMAKAIELDANLGMIIAANASLAEKVTYENTYFASVKALTTDSVRVSDEQDVNAALYRLKQMCNGNVKELVNVFGDRTLEQHLTTLKNRIEALKAESQTDLEAYEVLQDTIEVAIAEVAGLPVLTQVEISEYTAELKRAQTVAEVEAIVAQAKAKNDAKITTTTKEKQVYIDQINATLATVDPTNLEADNAVAYQDIVEDTMHLEAYTVNELKQLANRVKEDLAKIVAKDKQDKAIKAEKVAYDAVVKEVEAFINEIETKKVGQTPVIQAKLDEQIDILNLALNRGLTKEALMREKEVVAKEVARILTEDVVTPEEKEHQAAVDQAIAEIKALTSLTEDEQASFINRLNNSSVGFDVAAVVTEAKELANDHLEQATAEKEHQAAVEQAIAEIKALTSLTEDEQASFINRLNNSSVGFDVAAVVTEAKELANDHLEQATAEKEHQAAVEQAIAEIKALTGLTEDEKQDYLMKLKATQVGDDITSIVAQAKKVSSENLADEEAKAQHEAQVKQAQAVIEAMEGLTEDERIQYINELVNCEIGCDTNAIIYQAQQVAQKNLADAAAKEQHEAQVKQAQAVIEAMEGLTEDERIQYINELVNCEIGCDTNAIIYQAQQVAQKHLADAAAKEQHQAQVKQAIKDINALVGLSEAEKQNFIKQLQTSSVGFDVASVVKQAQQLSQKNIATENEQKAEKEHQAKVASAVIDIQYMNGLTATEKQEFIKQLQATAVGTELTSILVTAQQLATQHIAELEAKVKHQANMNRAIAQIRALTGLSISEKRGFIARVQRSAIGTDFAQLITKAKTMSEANQAVVEPEVVKPTKPVEPVTPEVVEPTKPVEPTLPETNLPEVEMPEVPTVVPIALIAPIVPETANGEDTSNHSTNHHLANIVEANTNQENQEPTTKQTDEAAKEAVSEVTEDASVVKSVEVEEEEVDVKTPLEQPTEPRKTNYPLLVSVSALILATMYYLRKQFKKYRI